MAIARVQATNFSYVGGGSNNTLTFPVLPAAGAFLIVGSSTGQFLGGPTVSISDNQGTITWTHISGGVFNDAASDIFYAYDIPALTGSLIITLTRLGSAFNENIAVGVEYSGFGSVDPIVGTSNGSGNAVSQTTGSTASLGAIPEALCFSVLATRNGTFSIPNIDVETVSPAWNVEGEHLPSCGPCVAAEIDDRIVPNGNAQSCTWSVGSPFGGSYGAIIACFFGAPPVADLVMYQTSRQVLEIDGTVGVNLYQVSRQVLYPFTCSGGPPPPPPGVEGCPSELPDAVAGGEAGCIPEF